MRHLLGGGALFLLRLSYAHHQCAAQKATKQV
jgi:hypothetical protein